MLRTLLNLLYKSYRTTNANKRRVSLFNNIVSKLEHGRSRVLQKLIQQLSIEIRVIRLLVEGIRIIDRIFGNIDEPFFVALFLLGDNFLADFVKDFFFDGGKIATDVGLQNLLLSLFVLSFAVFLILLIPWCAFIVDHSLLSLSCFDLLSFAADFVALQLAGPLQVPELEEIVWDYKLLADSSLLSVAIRKVDILPIGVLACTRVFIHDSKLIGKLVGSYLGVI